MRSSIACARCRRSKVKCVNNGVNTTCRACETTGRECTYPIPQVGGPAALPRAEGSYTKHPAGDVLASDTPKRPRPKKATAQAPSNVSTRESMRALVDALDPAILTPKIWIELFDIFQQNFSTDLPFIHPPTFLKPLRQMTGTTYQNPPDFGQQKQEPGPAASSLPGDPLFLLGFLALTARFHPQLVAHHSPQTNARPSNPLIASEYYAAACKARMSGNLGDGLGSPELARIQALLMSALHDWGNCQGAKAWVSVGVAIRYAQILGLQYECDLDDEPWAHSLALSSEAARLGVGQKRRQSASAPSKDVTFTEQEVRRRTFWSCFILDRYMSTGKYRPQMVQINDIRIQLPSSERAFMFGEKVRTLLIGDETDGFEGRAEVQDKRHASLNGLESLNGRPPNFDIYQGNGNTSESGRWEYGADEGIVSRYVKVIDLYGNLVKWSCNGGRRRERYPPWDNRSTFYGLQKRLESFKQNLPRDLNLNTGNISAHITSRTSTPYTLMHTVILLSTIVLHREYIPFIPLRCAKPQGPLDPPLLRQEEYQIPERYWEGSARELFKAARDLVDLLRTCQDWGVSVETPIVGFGIYTVAFIGVYAVNFPWMDPDGFMCRRQRISPTAAMDAHDDGRGAEAGRRALEMIGQMRSRLKMADGWFKTIKRSHNYYVKMKKDFRTNIKGLIKKLGPEAEEVQRHLTLREGGGGGGLEEFKLLESTLKEFGKLEDEDAYMRDAPDAEGARSYRGSESSAALKSEAMEMQEGTPDSSAIRQDRWNAINSSAAPPRHELSGPNGAHPPYFSTPTMAGAASQPSHILSHDRTQHFATTDNNSPLVSPSTQPASYPAHPPYQQNISHSVQPVASEQARVASVNLQQQLNPLPAPTTQEWTPEMQQQWEQTLGTRLGGDDVAAFTEGFNWDDWADLTGGNPGSNSWLSVIWGTPTAP